MDGIDIEGTPFSVLMDRAVKLKSLQVGEERKNFDKMPPFYQHSIFNQHEDVKSARSLDFSSRLAAAKDMKDEGNAAYQEGRWQDALLQYEKALSVFRYLENQNPDWKTQGIKDQFIKEISYQCRHTSQEEELSKLLRSCYNNIGLTCYKMKDYSQAIRACGLALIIDGKCDKSFYLRAKSRLAPLNSGAAEQEAAIDDLKMAIEMNPKNNEARKLLRHTKAKAKSQRSRDKIAFSGLFDRGEIYNADELAQAKQAQSEAKRVEDAVSKERDLILGRQLVQHYDERGMEDEKRRIESSINVEAKTDYANNVDFRKPTDKMINEAKSMGVDLSDPRTIEMLEQLQKNDKGEIGSSNGLASEDGTLHRHKSAIFLRIAGFIVLLLLWVLVVNSGFGKLVTATVK